MMTFLSTRSNRVPAATHRVAFVFSLSLALLLAPDRLLAQTEPVAKDAPSLHAQPEESVELAPMMSGLQRLTHKLTLSIHAANPDLEQFYLDESVEAIEDIQRAVPVYEGLPVAQLIDEILKPRFERLREALARDRKAHKNGAAQAALGELIAGCNQCHRATRHAFIKIRDRGDFNPFNQDFEP